jgi:YHS domain-containing protein
MARWIVLALVAVILYKMIGNELRKRSSDKDAGRAGEEARRKAAGKMVKDPVCGTYVDVEGGISVRDGDVVHRFCSYECRDAFLQRLRDGGREIPAKAPEEGDE